jgi:chemotaxis protein MotB
MAAAKEAAAPIIIKRVKKGGHGAPHGGSWKVAFADFATAMMAFFLLMWLMGATTEKQKGAISEYFRNPSAIAGASVVPSPTTIQGPGGSSTSMIQLGGGMELHKQAEAAAEETPPSPGAQVDVSPEEAVKAAEKLDAERLEGLLAQLRDAIDQREALAQFKEQILLDVTPEGIRIQIVDQERRSMFPLGSATLETYSANILGELAGIVNSVPNRISISGHTDIRPYVKVNYSNWELSADRANAARRALIVGGLPAEKIGRVVGLASSVLLDAQAPDSPLNRRISIIVMNKRTQDAISQENGALFSVQDPAEGAKKEGGTIAVDAQPVASANP